MCLHVTDIVFKTVVNDAMQGHLWATEIQIMVRELFLLPPNSCVLKYRVMW